MPLVFFNPLIGLYLCGTTPGQSGPGSDGNKEVPHIPQRLHIPWNPTIRLFSVISTTLVGGLLPFCRGEVGVFYSPRRLGKEHEERD